MFAYLFSKVTNTKFNNILQNLESEKAQIEENLRISNESPTKIN